MDLLKMPSDFIIQIAEISEPCHAHQHDYLVLAYIRQGWTQHTLQGESRKLTQGDFILVDDGEIHSYDIVGQNLQAINCMFRPSVIDGALGHCRKFQEVLDSCTLGMEYTKNCFLGKNKIFHDQTGEIRQILDRLLEESHRQDIGYFPMIRSLLTQMIILIVRIVGQQQSNIGQFSIRWMMDEIHRNPGKDHQLTLYAKRFGMRPEALSRSFQQEVGTGFQLYLRRVRIQMACKLLAESSSSIPQIGEECGYMDTKSFREVFRKETGLSPTQWKQKYAGKHLLL